MVKNSSSILRKSLFPVLCICVITMATAQNSIGTSSKGQQAFEYFQADQFNNVIKLLNTASEKSPDEQILLTLSRLKTGENVQSDIDRWLKKYPKHPLKSLAEFSYGEYAFYQGDTTTSKKYLAKIKASELSNQDQASYGFIYGVLNLQAGKYKNAKGLFNAAQKKGYKGRSQLTYYQAFTSYHLNELNEALKGFETIRNDPDYGVSSNFFIAKIYLESKEYDKVITMSQQELSDEQSKINSGFHQLIGEAYALRGDIAKADAYFDQAIKKHPSRPTSALYYQAGVSKFKVGNEDKALEYLTQSGIGAGPYAKLSAFQLGRLHIKRNEPELALTAYIEASSSDDQSIKEESIYQVAKLSASLNRYPEAIDYSTDYLTSFPDGKWRLELQNLIAQCYLKTSNFDQAIAYLEQNGITDQVRKEVYQKVTFQKGVLLFNDADFRSARTMFQKSLSHPISTQLSDESHFYLGEIYSREGNYQQALASYNRQSAKTGNTYYGMGYARYNQQKYADAISHFRKAKDNASPSLKADARLRLADCLYAEKQYSEALSNYTSLEENDYVVYQKGMVHGNLGRLSEAIVLFNRVSATSGLKDDALYQGAKLSFEDAKFDQAEKGFSRLIEAFPSSEYVSRAYLNRAIARSNLQKLEQAKSDYELVVERYIREETAFSAILGLQELQQKGINVGNLDKFIEQYKKANPGDNSLEVVEFEAAKGLYFDLAYTAAIPKLSTFLKEYPQSKFGVEGAYYLADAYYRTNQLEKAKEEFEKQKFVRNVYTGRVLTRLGDINTSLQLYNEAIEAYQLLEQLNLTPKDTYNARFGMLNAYFLSAKYQEAIQMADQLLQSEWKPLNSDQSATFFKAQSYFQLNDLAKATEEYLKLAGGQDVIAVNASYQLAYIQYSQGEYEESLDRLFELNAKFGTYSEWIDKSYLLIADNYIATDELFQAKATLRSIVQHTQNEEVRREAQSKLNSIEQVNENDSTQNQDK